MVGLKDSVAGYTITEDLGVRGEVARFRAVHEKSGAARYLVLANHADAGPLRAVEQARPRHPQLATFMESIDADGMTGIATEIPSGGSLAERLRSTPLPMDTADALELIEGVLDALAAMHEDGLVHGSVGPDTIWFRGEDIGSMVLMGAGAPGAVPGMTVPPEMAHGVSTETDVFMVSALLEKLVTDPDWGQAPNRLVPVFRTGQRADTRSRYSDASDLRRALEQAMSDEEEEEADDGLTGFTSPDEASTNGEQFVVGTPGSNAPAEDQEEPTAGSAGEAWDAAWDDGFEDIPDHEEPAQEPAPVPRPAPAAPSPVVAAPAMVPSAAPPPMPEPEVPAPRGSDSGAGVIAISGTAASMGGAVAPAPSRSGTPRIPSQNGNKVVVGFIMACVAAGPFLFKFAMGWLLSPSEPDTPMIVIGPDGMPTTKQKAEPKKDAPKGKKQLDVRVAVDVDYPMVRIEKGKHTVGSPGTEVGRDRDEAPLTVTLPAFEIGTHEVTQGTWHAVMGTRPVEEGHGVDLVGGESMGCREFGLDDTMPVVCVSWYEAVRFANRLSNLQGLSAAYEVDGSKVKWLPGSNGFRLPTEIEWEAAARAGSAEPWGAYTIEELCSFGPLASNRTLGRYPHLGVAAPLDCESDAVGLSAVGQSAEGPNGLYDMIGNVSEWTWDPYDPIGVVADAAVQEQKNRRTAAARARVIRGSSWGGGAYAARLAARDELAPSKRSYLVGFRLARGKR